MTEDTHVELERFRKQWREEVVARTKAGTSSQQIGAKPEARRRSSVQAIRPRPAPSIGHDTKQTVDEDSHVSQYPTAYHDLEDKDERRRLEEDTVGIHPSHDRIHEPQSALEHYEKAVEKETQGSLGDSLTHYRKAYRLDDRVDQIYKNKYFPPSALPSKPSNLNPSNAAVTVPNPAHHSLHGHPANISQLIASFASDTILGAPSPTEASPPPPCPLASVPFEVLIEILYRTAVLDIAAYTRLALVCKRLAYLVSTEDRIWKRVCTGPEFGFSAMHYEFSCEVDGTSFAPSSPIPNEASTLLSLLSLNPPSPPISLPLPPANPTYKHLFQHQPRLRFNGCYISTVNYVRPGASSPSQVSWNTPVHIVTYYRYLRFFRDGTCISLLTTAEPADVVHHLLKEHLHHNHSGGLPSSIMRHALRGRWRLSACPFAPSPEIPLSTSSAFQQTPQSKATQPRTDKSSDPPGNLYLETEGPDAKYTYSMHLALRSASARAGATRNNKLVWRGFWSYNRLTDDWAEFGLRNDKAFFWSRVRSWGTGW
ncbi:hypothetical protein MMC13_001986 [Lambiella insularis]|nr:hypothetical protein [Lambiella insularis]